MDFDSPKRESRKKYPPARTIPATITIYSERANILPKVVCGGRNEKWTPRNLLKVEGCLRWEMKYYRVNPGHFVVFLLQSAHFLRSVRSVPGIRGVCVWATQTSDHLAFIPIATAMAVGLRVSGITSVRSRNEKRTLR